METNNLWDVFGGQDNLVLMCEARRFIKGVKQDWACFEFDLYRVDLITCTPRYYGIFIKHMGTGRVVVNEQYLTPE
jgi:hypothetical protein